MSRGGKENFRLEQDQEVVLLKGLFLQQKKMCLCLWQWRLKSMLCEFFSLANSQQQLLLYSSYRADVTIPLVFDSTVACTLYNEDVQKMLPIKGTDWFSFSKERSFIQ